LERLILSKWSISYQNG